MLQRVLRRDDWRKTRALFVLSTGRTGTQSLTHLLNLSPGITAFHEPEPVLWAESLEAFHHVFTDQRFYGRVFARARRRPLLEAYRTQSLYAETSNRMTYFAPAIANMLDNSRFVHLYRHPADVIRSGMRRGWYQNHALDRFRISPSSTDPAATEWNDWSAFEKICWYWTAINDFASRFAQTLPQERFLSVRFESLFENDSPILETLYTFLGVSPPANNEIRRTLDVRHNAQHNGEFPTLEGFTDDQAKSLERIAGPTMQHLGYRLQ